MIGFAAQHRHVFAALLIGICANATTASAQSARDDTWPFPRQIQYQPDWDEARHALGAMSLPAPGDDVLAGATALTATVFPEIAKSPVPVLLPFALADYAHEVATDAAGPVDSYTFGFAPTRFVFAGPTGYDAAFSLSLQDHPDLGDINFANPVMVLISGFNLHYELPAPKGAIRMSTGALGRNFPGLRKQILESTLHYSFERYGISYVVAIQCFNGAQRRKRLSCRNADRIGTRFVQALRLVGGNPQITAQKPQPVALDRPSGMSDAFAYHTPGQLIPKTAMRAPDGDPDPHVYARIRFPLAQAPAYVNSEAFRRRDPERRAAAAGAADLDPAVHPWRDNFCERRHFFVGQCPAGLGHQGQDIRGASCVPDGKQITCKVNHDVVVAARDGMIQREDWQNSFFLVTNADGERLRFRHLHMHPRHLDKDGIESGRMVAEGEPIGTVSNFSRRPGLTSTHLHFEILVPTRDGWVRVNPYMTLVASYEHLIGGRGEALGDDSAAGQAQGGAQPEPAAATSDE